jgi:hypothetical protein
LLEDHKADACVRGCYRCLLSYYNQPDHEQIDRTNLEARQLLVDLARGILKPRNSLPKTVAPNGWLAVFRAQGLPDPDSGSILLGGQSFPFVWRKHRIAATSERLGDDASAHAEDTGWSLFQFPALQSDSLPSDFLASLKGKTE